MSSSWQIIVPLSLKLFILTPLRSHMGWMEVMAPAKYRKTAR
jgi:hypothetical protein